MDLALKDKIILVSGSAGKTGSIGETIIKSLANEGAIPVLVDRNERGIKYVEELAAKGIDAEWNEIQHNLLERDRIDSSRADSPLREAADSVVIDNTLLSEEQQLEKALALAHEKTT